MEVRERAETDYDALFVDEYPKVLRTVALLLGDVDAGADVTQEAFVQLHLHWAKVRGYDRPGAWVRRVAVREAMRVLRRRSRQALVALEQAEAEATTSGRLDDLDLRAAVAALPAGQRAAVVLHYLEDLPVREVAEVIGCAEATAKVHLHRGRKRLAQVLGEEER